MGLLAFFLETLEYLHPQFLRDRIPLYGSFEDPGDDLRSLVFGPLPYFPPDVFPEIGILFPPRQGIGRYFPLRLKTLLIDRGAQKERKRCPSHKFVVFGLFQIVPHISDALSRAVRI